MEATAPLVILLSSTFAETKVGDFSLFLVVDEQLFAHHPSFLRELIELLQVLLVFPVMEPVF